MKHFDTRFEVGELEPEVLTQLRKQDPLKRSWHFSQEQPKKPFDAQWNFNVIMHHEHGLGYVHVEAAKLFAIQSAQEPKWEAYQFGTIIDFPLVTGLHNVSPEHQFIRELMVNVISQTWQRFSQMPLYCLLPKLAEEQLQIILDLGFINKNSVCMDTDFLAAHGYEEFLTGGETSSVEILELSRKPAEDQEPTDLQAFPPLHLLTTTEENLRIFSNPQTKVRLQPTLEFWQPIQLYTTYSAYPLIPVFLEEVLKKFQIQPPKRLLVAPCGAGDFLRFWPQSDGAELPQVLGIDIRPDLLKIAERRTQSPDIDLLNLILCETLSKAVNHNGLPHDLYHEFRRLCREVVRERFHSRINDFVQERHLLLVARTFDEILQNRAIPDWFFPLKILAAIDGLSDSIRADQLAGWLLEKRERISIAVANANNLAIAENGRDVRQTYRMPGLGKNCKLRLGDLTRSWEEPGGLYDCILCWEFIHVFHDRTSLGNFLDSMLNHLAPGGTFILTNIREFSEDTPPEQEWARLHLKRKAIEFQCSFLTFEDAYAPFKRRLNAWYPVLIARK